MSGETILRPRASISTWVGIATTFAAVIAGYMTISGRTADHERRLLIVEERRERDASDTYQFRALLERIDERTKATDERVKDLKAQIERKL